MISLKKISEWYDKRSFGTKNFISAFATTIPIYGSAYLSVQIPQIIKVGGNIALGVHAFTVIFLITIITALFYMIRFEYRERDRKRKIIIEAYGKTDEVCCQETEELSNYCSVDEKKWHDILITSNRRICRLIDSLYDIFERNYGQRDDIGGAIDFEVTFMTKSYFDGNITIPASANRERRTPPSMLKRQQDPHIYDRTVTADVYQMTRPTPILVEDTSKGGWKALYDGQKDRIKSTIIFPVLSGKNELLGTIVVHCNKTNFFRETELSYWRELLEIFAKRVAQEKLRFDIKYNCVKGITIAIPDVMPF